jgi:hypothetical protein
LFTKHPYREQGKRTRYEYVLTEMGRDLLPALLALLQWGDKYLQPEGGGPLRLEERTTGDPIRIVARGSSGAELHPEDITVSVNANAAQSDDPALGRQRSATTP